MTTINTNDAVSVADTTGSQADSDDDDDDNSSEKSAKREQGRKRNRGSGRKWGDASSGSRTVTVASTISGADELQVLVGRTGRMKTGMHGFGQSIHDQLIVAMRDEYPDKCMITVQVLAGASDKDLVRWRGKLDSVKRPRIETMQVWRNSLYSHIERTWRRRLH